MAQGRQCDANTIQLLHKTPHSEFACQKQRRADKAPNTLSLSMIPRADTHACMHNHACLQLQHPHAWFNQRSTAPTRKARSCWGWGETKTPNSLCSNTKSLCRANTGLFPKEVAAATATECGHVALGGINRSHLAIQQRCERSEACPPHVIRGSDQWAPEGGPLAQDAQLEI